MLWAIDVGNTHTVFGLWDGHWRAVWRLSTQIERTEDELAGALQSLCGPAGLSLHAEAVVVGSVVPRANFAVRHLAHKWLGCEPRFLSRGDQVGIDVLYDPPHAVGADRIANALAALASDAPPVVVVDFGTATTFDCIDAQGRYVGGAIMPGPLMGIDALAERTAKLPPVELEEPGAAVGRTTVSALQAGVTYGYAGAIDALLERMAGELPGATVLATGGLGRAYQRLCRNIERYEPELTLDGLRLAWPKLASAER